MMSDGEGSERRQEKTGKNTRSRILSAEGCLTDILVLARERVAAAPWVRIKGA